MSQEETKTFRSEKKSENKIVSLAKQLPAHIDAEKAVLGALLLNDELIQQVSDILDTRDFYVPAHRFIFESIMILSQQLKRVDLLTLENELLKRDKLEVIGGMIYLLALQEDIPSIGMLETHAKIVKEKAVLRDLINAAGNIIGACYQQQDKDVSTLLDDAEQAIFTIANNKTEQNFVQLSIWLKKTFQHISDIKSNSGGLTGIASGYFQLDHMTSGFQNGDLIILAARPSMGKTALALNIAAHIVAQGHSVGVFSLEMAAEQLTLRLLSSESGIAHHTIRNATITSEEWIELTNVAARLAETKLFIDDSATLDIMSLRAKARKLKIQENTQMIIIDYLQLLQSSKRHENRHQEVSEISRALKALAKELNIPILALSQLSRAVDSRMDKRPILSDLRESGAIEQDADLIMFLYRDVVYNQDTDNPAGAELIIGKQRNGPTGIVSLTFLRELTKFENNTQGY